MTFYISIAQWITAACLKAVDESEPTKELIEYMIRSLSTQKRRALQFVFDM